MDASDAPPTTVRGVLGIALNSASFSFLVGASLWFLLRAGTTERLVLLGAAGIGGALTGWVANRRRRRWLALTPAGRKG